MKILIIDKNENEDSIFKKREYIVSWKNLGEIKKVIKFYDKNKSIRETSREFNISYSTIQDWIKEEL